MAYCDKADIIARVGDKVDGWTGSDDAVVRAVCDSAAAEIDGYLASGGHELPLASVPEVLTVHAVSIAVYRLLVRTGVLGDTRDPGQNPIMNDYKQAVRFLEMLASGKLRLAGTSTAPQSGTQSNSGMQVRSYDKLDLERFI